MEESYIRLIVALLSAIPSICSDQEFVGFDIVARVTPVAQLDKDVTTKTETPEPTTTALAASTDCVWQGPVSGMVLKNYNVEKTIPNITTEQCRKACESETKFKCLSFARVTSSSRNLRDCQLSSKSSKTAWLSISSKRNAYFELECKQSAKDGEDDICLKPRDLGRGRKRIKTYYYNKGAKKCRMFYYKGSGGNSNRFQSIQDCAYTCFDFPDRCSRTSRRGKGDPDFWYNSIEAGNCQKLLSMK